MPADHVDQLSDAPIEDPTLDRLGRNDFATRIARTIGAQSDANSLVVGLYGPWGDGKTSLLRLVETAFGSDESIVTIRFNPWQLGDELSVFRGFFATVADALDEKLASTGQSIGKLLKSYGSLLKPIPIVGGVASDMAAAAGEKLAEDMASLDKQKKAIEKILKDAGKRVVIFIDDIDRLDDTEIQVIFRLVKVAADFANTAYVLAFDDAVVSAALGRRYTVGTIHGTNFLDKIVQLPLHLPAPDPTVLRMITLEVIEAAIAQVSFGFSDLEAKQFVNVFDRTVRPMLSTLRVSKRYGNALTFAVPMIGDEVHVPDLVLIEAMRIFYKPLYEWVRVNRAAVLDGVDHTDAGPVAAAFKELTEGLRPEQQSGARNLLNHLFPRTESIWENKRWGNEWLRIWSEQRRIASPDYFERYFTYTIGVHDVSDADITRYIELLGQAGGADDADVFATQLIERHPSKFLAKLQSRVGGLDDARREALAVSLTALAEVLPDQLVNQFFTVQDQAARLIVETISGLPEGTKQALASAVVQAAKPLSFALELFQWLRHTLNEEANPDEVQPEDCAASRDLGAALGARIERAWSGTAPDISAFGKYVTSGLWVWSEYVASKELVRARVKNHLLADPALAVAVLRASLPRTWAYETNMPLPGSVRRETYDAIVDYFDAATMVDALKALFGADIGTGEYYAKEDAELNVKIAHQFVSLYLSVEAAKMDSTQPQVDGDVDLGVPPAGAPLEELGDGTNDPEA